MQIDNEPYQRNHSCSKKPSSAQIASICLFVTQALIFYIYVATNLQDQSTKIIMICLFSISFTLLIFFSLYTGQLDPSDDLFIWFKNQNYQKIKQYRDEGHNVKLFFCGTCNSTVKEKSRHCRVCGRCSQEFDHHCIWLNTCIGGKNYKPFIVTISLTFTTFALYIVAICILTADIQQTTKNFRTPGFIIAWIMGVVFLVFLFLITSLIILHIYLNCKGLSTYELIVLRNEQQKRQKALEQQKKLAIEQAQRDKVANRVRDTSLQNINTNNQGPTSINEDFQNTHNLKDQIQSTPHKQYETSFRDSKFSTGRKLTSLRDREILQSQLSGSSETQKNSKKEQNLNQFVDIKQTSSINSESNQIGEKSLFGSHQQNFSEFGNKYHLDIKQKSKKKTKVNNFILKNASVNFLIGKNYYENPVEDIRKTIQLEQKLEEFSKNKSQIFNKDLNPLSFSNPSDLASNKKIGRNKSKQIKESQVANSLNFQEFKKVINLPRLQDTGSETKGVIINPRKIHPIKLNEMRITPQLKIKPLQSETDQMYSN